MSDPQRSPRVISLTTDFGCGDPDIGSLSGVIWGIAPGARIVDLSHDIQRHNARQAALLLDRVTPYFPPGSIHVIVVDPGVGTNRRPLAARFGEQWFVGPDNGVATLMLRRAQKLGLPVEMVEPDKFQFMLPEISDIFHGRDVFAPTAAHIARGVPLDEIGAPINDPVLLDFPEPRQVENGWLGEVKDIDQFGNLETNIHQDLLKDLGEPGAIDVRINGETIHGLVKTFGERGSGEFAALADSSGYLSINVVNGSAQRRLDAKVGDPVEVRRQAPGA